MYRSTLKCSLALAMALLLCPSGSLLAGDLNTLTEQEEAEGWQLLFDGKTTNGWRNYKRDNVSSGWQVVDGALTRAGERAGDIISVEKFGSFELLIDYKIEPGGNSGIMYRVTEEYDAPWHSGPEIQILDNAKGEDPQRAGWLYQLYKADTDATKPAGEWNTLRIIITPSKCEHYMNGVKYVEYVIGSEDWNAQVAKSKFARYSNFGKATEGHICLQDHGNLVAYRNIKIRRID